MLTKEIPTKESCPRRFAKKCVGITAAFATILLIQTILILASTQYLHASSASQPDQFARVQAGMEQTGDCTVSSYEVQPGDTINDVASQAGTTTQRVRDCNNLSSDVIFSGQTLNLPNAVNRNQGTTPNTMVTRAYRPTTPSNNTRYQNPNNGSPYNGQRNARPSRGRWR